ncbi:MAG TPA: efflux RND transporter periplasmic adaptor subunit [Acidobacteriaceae bacterium]|jgi:RND family efflux transporter MFP subunit|nr:efflux RND transporter periplasmic adaptor subunit [Acidobacteriaceae bacterium]
MRSILPLVTLLVAGVVAGCTKAPPPAAAAGFQAMPVQTITVAAAPVPQTDEYEATIKSRRSATINPQVDGNLTAILVHSGDHVKTGQLLMQIDPAKQEATVDSQKATAQQKLAVFQYNQLQVDRQRKLFASGIISKDALDQAEQAFANSKADYESSQASAQEQEKELAYYRIAAPFDGIVGDIPVHVGDYVSSTTMLTTVDENKDLEAYIYIPTERAAQVRNGLGVEILDNDDNPIEKSAIDFVSPEVDNGLQGILVKAPVHSATLRTAQLVKARVIWGVSAKPVVPVLAVTRLGGQAFVFVAQSAGAGKFVAHQQAISLGDTMGNNYAVLSGLTNGDKVIVSGTQILMDGMPVIPMPSGPPPGPPGAGAPAAGR